MNQLENTLFRRLFAVNMFKNKRLLLAEMSFHKDFVNEKRGMPYPLTVSYGTRGERIEDGRYLAEAPATGAAWARLIGGHFPYASYEIAFKGLEGTLGILISTPKASVLVSLLHIGNSLTVSLAEGEKVQSAAIRKELFRKAIEKGTCRLQLTCRGNKIDVYLDAVEHPEYLTTFTSEALADIKQQQVYETARASLYVAGNCVIRSVCSYLDCGISQADIRPITYENGETMVEKGKVYFTVSNRLQEGCYQGIYAWLPGTAEFEFTGVLFFDTGDGSLESEVGSSLHYDRNRGVWYLWTVSFSHNHVLGRTEFTTDPRFGLQIIDIELMKNGEVQETSENMPGMNSNVDFYAVSGDEDPDLIYVKETGKWMLAICRLVREGEETNYRYHFYESDEPLDGFHYIGQTESGADTGGSFRYIDGKLLFICGSCFDRTSEYRVYEVPDFAHYTTLKHDVPDGGFRGWGSVFEVPVGTRKKLYHLTFDRANGSDYNWSYGNLYGFEGV